MTERNSAMSNFEETTTDDTEQSVRPRAGPPRAADLVRGAGSPGRPRTWGKARGRVAPDQANYLIMTFGILGSVVTGTAGAVLTLRIAPRLTGLALAELVLALAAVLIIAVGRLSQEQPPYLKSNRREIVRADNRETGTTDS